MNPTNTDRLKRYFQIISKSRGGSDAMLDTIARRAGALRGAGAGLESLPAAEAGARASPLAAARGGIEAMARGRDLTHDEFLSVEAIIDEDLRPAFDVVGDRFQADHWMWTHLSSDAAVRVRIETVLPSIGRIELPGHPRLPYGGTGFVVGKGLLMTNRHVAEVFASGVGDRRLAFKSGARAGINFVRELGRPDGGPTLLVRRVVMIHPYWDMALLAVDGLPECHQPLRLAVQDARDLVAREVFVVGYPAFDPRNPADVQNDLFNGRFGIKRLQPGELQGGIRTASFGKTVMAASHDCSTLGGNSGSAVVDLASGEVFGLHFGGAYHEANFAVPAFALASDSRVVDAGVCFAGPAAGAANTWAEWWARADAAESAEADPRSSAGAGAPARAAATRTAASPQGATLASHGNGAITLQLPLHITVSLGSVSQGVVLNLGSGVLAGADDGGAAEAMREPQHDTEYSSRKGYSDRFLGEDAAFRVPLPQAANASVVAPTRAGQQLLHYQNFSLAMHARRRLALFTASNVTKEVLLRRPESGHDYTRKGLSGLGANDVERWFIDPRLEERYQLPDVFFTKDRQAFDKGHVVRRDDITWGTSYQQVRRANGDSYHVTNCSPQVSGFNQSAQGQDNWGDLENHVLASAASERLCVLAGPVLAASDTVFVGVGDGGTRLRVRVPSRFWKVIVARTEDALAAFGFVLEQDLSDVQWEEFVVPDNFVPTLTRLVDIEAMTGVAFAATLRDADQFDSVRGAELVWRGAAAQPVVL